MLLVIALISLLWLAVVAVVVALCVMAARADAPRDQAAPAQSPRRPSTWGIVRRRIFTSPHSDQLATYK